MIEAFSHDCDIVMIALTQGQVMLVDPQDADLALKHWWSTIPGRNTAYAGRAPNGRGMVYIHREILSNPTDGQVDHIDRDGLNNTRENLRVVSVSANQHNRDFDPDASINVWVTNAGKTVHMVRMRVNGRAISMGAFPSRTAARLLVRINRARILKGMPVVGYKRANVYAPWRRHEWSL